MLADVNVMSAADQRRLQLIKATIQSINDYGLSNVTIAKVAASAGLSQGIVNFHFEGKRDLLINTLTYAIREYYQAMEAAYDRTDDPVNILKTVIDLSFGPQLCNLEKIATWYAFWGECSANKDYFVLCRDADQRFRDTMAEVCARLHGTEKKHASISAFARAFGGLIDDHWIEFLLNPETFDRNVARQTCLDYLDAFFPGQFNSKDNPTSPDVQNDNTSTCTNDVVDLLAPWTYNNKEFFELEKALIFKKSWLIAGHISDIPDIGDYLTFDAIGERAVIIRGKDNQLNAFHNICRHRGAKVLDKAQGNCPRALVCQFHGWSYNQDGSIRNIPQAETFTGLEKRDNNLVKLAVEIWFGFIFINFSKTPDKLSDTLTGVADCIRPYLAEHMLPLPGSKYRQLRKQNWKIIHDIDNEGYHIPVGHPSLQQLYGKDYQDHAIENLAMASINEKPGKLWSVRHYQKILPSFDHLPKENQRRWVYIGIFPTIVIGLYPDMIEYYMSIPKSSGESEYIGAAYGLADSRREVKLSRYLTQRINRITEQEDEKFVRWIQDNINSSVFPQLQLSSLEQGVSAMHKKIQNCIPVGTLAHAPDSHQIDSINQQMLRKLTETKF